MIPLRPSTARPPRQGNELEYQPLHESERPHLNFPRAPGFQRFFQVSFIIPILLVVTVIVAGFMMMAESITSESHLRLSTVTGYFMQDEPTTDPDTFDYVTSNFGLIPRSYDSDAEFDPDGRRTQWERFEHHIKKLNAESRPETSYRLLYLGRHGEGYHNVAERRYGTEAWDCYWSLLDGDDNGTWVDARLTPVGIAQAETAHRVWETQIENKIPFPQSYYVSPLNRCLATASITFRGLKMPHTEPFRPVVKELLRETIGLHTCDSRSSKTAIQAEYPEYIIEDGFAEEDPLYDPKLRESDTARDARLRDLLQDIFTHDENTFISLTAHSGAITSILQVTGHRKFALATGAVIPVLVKVERVSGPLPKMHIDPPTTAPVCKN
ncbi:phosphomutase-like protein 3 [Aspergillus lentulus]|uniref:Phosphomutase-like protein 3 n=1 Tax=Aspergillus lentulus TaxID=293939 RepID=A0ABQ0ZU23_ASPLE|nr:phosphomutase-like protein 3 [Aspergillus lentulus]GFF64122.1 phosphomutase-like protein 3 [Aspergillus lentulus]GFF67914.1 phosphomutase-like protein 3 [Aspergillus lentulus]GFF99067.1 phosphomutase-like protein 3 [Aspergillus lentulus]